MKLPEFARVRRRRTAIAISLVVLLVSSSMPFSAVAGAARQARGRYAGLSSVNSSLMPFSLPAERLTPELFDGIPVAAEQLAGSISATRRPAPLPSKAIAEPGTSRNAVRRIGFSQRATASPARALASPLMLQGGGNANAIAGGAVVRHAVTINSSRVEGSVRQLLGEDVTLNGGAVVTGDLLVPGTPQVTVNGSPSIGAIVDGTGSINPANYHVTINGNVQLGRLVRRTDPVTMPTVAAPPASTGTRSVVINSPGQSVGDFATLRDLTLNGNVGIYSIPSGTYRNFIANSGAGFSLAAGALRCDAECV